MSRRALVASIYAAAAVLAWVGWREMWFLTDDAFISFRYLSNAFDGRGLVWNPPPFLPVEGYTNFGWIALLGAVWATTGIAPPRAANALSFALGLGTLAFALRIAWRARLPARFEPWRPALAALALLGIATNRTFVTWLSSGLETSLFTLCVVGFFLTNPDVDHAALRAYFGSVPMVLFSTLMVLSTAAHAWIGMWTVGTDYIRDHYFGRHSTAFRMAYQGGCLLILFVYVVWALQLFWSL